MLLTIITITYNAEAVLERTLKSIAQQTHQDFEYLLIDGGSKDRTMAIAHAYPSVISNSISEPDKGIYDAMNKGLILAKGQYVWFMNAGDQLFDKHTVANIMQCIAETKPDVIYGDSLLVDDHNNSLGLRSQFTPHALPKSLTWLDFDKGMVVCHQSFIPKKTIAPPYILDHFYSADIDWEIKCLKASQIVSYLDQPLSRYLTGGFSVKNLRKSLWDRFVILSKHFGLGHTLWNHLLIMARGITKIAKTGGRYW
jgi:glycosyltransferase involved in cell wall biosynthesis